MACASCTVTGIITATSGVLLVKAELTATKTPTSDSTSTLFCAARRDTIRAKLLISPVRTRPPETMNMAAMVQGAGLEKTLSTPSEGTMPTHDQHRRPEHRRHLDGIDLEHEDDEHGGYDAEREICRQVRVGEQFGQARSPCRQSDRAAMSGRRAGPTPRRTGATMAQAPSTLKGPSDRGLMPAQARSAPLHPVAAHGPACSSRPPSRTGSARSARPVASVST